MVNEPSIWSFVANAGAVVKFVILLLFLASLASWTIILQRGAFLKKIRAAIKDFEVQFWEGCDINKLYGELKQKQDDLGSMEHIFFAGMKEFKRLNAKTTASPEAIAEGAERAMRIATAQEADKLERHLSFLATVGSTSPYVGLFGTVWGIMTSFRALGIVQQATIAMVAPGISEALIATAMGLFAAIPAVIAYNRYAALTERVINHYETFQNELSSILHREAYGQNQL